MTTTTPRRLSTDRILFDLLKVSFGIPKESVLGALFFFLCINYLHNSISFSLFHFADDKCLVNIQDNKRVINKILNKDPGEFFWLNTNKIAFNVAKTEIIIFKTSNTIYDEDLKIKLFRKRFHACPHVKYFVVFIDEKLNWKFHINEISPKLIKGNASLSKLRHFVNKDILLPVYYSIFTHIQFISA